MEKTKSIDIKVGLFVAIGVILFLISILVVGGDKAFLADYVTYKGRVDSAQGLNSGSIVSLAGLRVGNVSKIDFTEDSSQLQILFKIESKYKDRITKNARFSVKTQGALGDKYIYIDPGTEPGGPLEDGDYILSDSSGDLFDVIAGKSEEFGRAADVIVEVHKFLLALNKDERTAKLMANLLSTSNNLNQFISEARVAIKELKGNSDGNLSHTLERFTSILEKVDEGKGTLGALVNDPSLHNRILTLMGESPRNSYLKPLIRKTIKARDEIKSE